jgi:hypothetical protein
MNVLRTLAILGNGLFILWILYNAIDEAGQPIGAVQITALLTLIVLLVVNIFLLSSRSAP